jgi:hypothetical protein
LNDPFFNGQYNGLPYEKEAVGYRYNLNDDSALKAEVSKTGFQASSATQTGTGFTELRLNYSIRF